MSRVITFSRFFPAYHPKKGMPTFFVEKVLNSLDENWDIWADRNIPKFPADFEVDAKIKEIKYHTIRAGNRWKAGDYFSPRVWSGKPYNSKQIVIAPDIQVKKVWNVEIELGDIFQIMKPKGNKEWHLISNGDVAKNDGLEYDDFVNWFNAKPKKQYDMLKAQIICWNENINY